MPDAEWWLPPLAQACVHYAVVVAALANIVLFPVLLAFVGRITASAEPAWYVCFWVLDALLCLDVVCRFFTPLRFEGELVMSRKAVAFAYISSGGLLYDFLCRFPWDAVLDATAGHELGPFYFAHNGTVASPKQFQGFAFGYGHLARLLLTPIAYDFAHDPAAKRKLVGMPTFISPSKRLATLMLASLAALNWYACLLWLVAQHLAWEGRSSWITLKETDTSPPWTMWPPWARYFRSLDHAALIVIGEGKRGDTHEEAVLGLLGLLLGIVWIAYFTSNMVALVSMMNQSNELALRRIARLKTFCSLSNLTPELSAKAVAHLEYVLLVRKLDLDLKERLFELSAPLRAEIALQRCQAFLFNPKFRELMGTNDEAQTGRFIKVLVTALQFTVFSPGDFFFEQGESGHEIFFLASGTVAVIANRVEVTTLFAGQCFGEIALLIPGIVRTASVVGKSFCEVHSLTRDSFDRCLASFPDIAANIRVVAEERLKELNIRLEQDREKQGARPGPATGAADPLHHSCGSESSSSTGAKSLCRSSTLGFFMKCASPSCAARLSLHAPRRAPSPCGMPCTCSKWHAHAHVHAYAHVVHVEHALHALSMLCMLCVLCTRLLSLTHRVCAAMQAVEEIT